MKKTITMLLSFFIVIFFSFFFSLSVDAKNSSKEYVAYLAICSTKTTTDMSAAASGEGFGHSWIMVTNISDSTLKVGSYNLNPNETVSIGLWGLFDDYTIKDGIWYNAEMYVSSFGKYKNYEKAYTKVDIDGISRLTKFLAVSDFYSTRDMKVCSTFAIKAWGATVPENEMKFSLKNIYALPTDLGILINNMNVENVYTQHCSSLKTQSKCYYTKNGKLVSGTKVMKNIYGGN